MKKSPVYVAAFLLAAGLSTNATAQQRSPLQKELSAWQQSEGPQWLVSADAETGMARMLYGGMGKAPFVPINDADYFLAARAHFSNAQALMGVEPSTMREDSVLTLPLGLVGTSDKVTVHFQQEVHGIPVRGGYSNALMTLDGELLSLDHMGLPNVSDFNVNPTRTASDAVGFAQELFGAEFGLSSSLVGTPKLVIEQEVVNTNRRGALAWELVITSPENGAQPTSYRYLVSAQGEARVITRENMIHNFDVGGTVAGRATQGNSPDTASNPAVAEPMAYMRVTSSAGTTTTDANGNWNFPGVTGPLTVTFNLVGSYNDVRNSAGAELSESRTLTGTGNSTVLNGAAPELGTAQVNVFARLNQMRDWVRSINPADGMMDFVNTANANIGSSCNAFYNGISTNYYTSGGGCVNTAYASVIYHEQGHWLNDRYNSGNGFDGFGEGNADVYATYQEDSPIVGKDFLGPGTLIRDGNNNRQFCGDSNPGCYGEVHNDGEVLMGAMWKVRTALKNSHGVSMGGAIADALHSGWMNAYDQGQIKSIIVMQWLVLDDDNGNLADGTPNIADINSGFVQQGFPPFLPPAPGSFSVYGTGLGGANIATLSTTGTPNPSAPISLTVNGIPGASTGLMVFSTALSNSPFLGGTALVNIESSVVRLPITFTAGSASFAVNVPAGLAGQTFFVQGFGFDAGQSQGVAMSNGVEMVIGT